MIDAGHLFRRQFGASPSVLARAPGRVELMGSHTDYNLGRVLTLPIHLETQIALGPRTDRTVRVYTAALDRLETFEIDDLARSGSWTDYLKGIVSVLQAEGRAVTGFDAVIESTIPIGAGLSSSAALECAAITALAGLGGWTLEPLRMAEWCQRAENEFVGVQCGLLDQYSACVSGAGGALLLDCRNLTSRPIALAPGLQVVVCDTRSPRELAGSEYGSRRAECEEGARLLGAASLRDVGLDRLRDWAGKLPPVIERRCRFILEEDARVVAFAGALSAGDRPAIARLTTDSFRGACDLFEIGAASMTAMHTAMTASPGFIGGRQSGAGFGGCLVAIVEEGAEASFAAAVKSRYEAATGIAPAVFAVSPGRAADHRITRSEIADS